MKKAFDSVLFNLSVLLSVFFGLVIITLADEDIDFYSGYKLGDTVKVIDKKTYYDARLYLFTDISACTICNMDINAIKDNLSKYKIEFIVFFNGADQNDIKEIAEKYHWDFKLIGDEYGIYKAYYQIKFQPLMMILDNTGKLINMGKVGGERLDMDSVINTIDRLQLNASNNHIMEKACLKEIKLIPVLKDNKPFISGMFRNLLFDKKHSQFFLRHNRECNLYIIDSLGNIRKTVNANSNSNYSCFMSRVFSWAIDDSLIFMCDAPPHGYGLAFQFYDISKDSITESKDIIFKYENRISYNSQFIQGKDRFILHDYRYSIPNTALTNNDTLIYLYDTNNNLIKAFDVPDQQYQEYKRSQVLSIDFEYKSNKLFSLQQCTNNLKIWDHNGNIINTLKLDMGKSYRNVDFDFKGFGSKPLVAEYWNNISRTQAILFDEESNHILICYSNATYPPGIYDYLSDEVKTEIYFNIYDLNGNKLNSKDILMPSSCLPFYFNDSQIYTTELNKNKLEIHEYLFNP